MKKLLLIVMVAFFGLAYNVNAKGEKTEAKTETPTVSNAKDDTRYYFPISTNGNSFTSSSVPEDQNSPECAGSNLQYCDSGLTSDQVTISGGMATVNSGVTPADGVRSHKQ